MLRNLWLKRKFRRRRARKLTKWTAAGRPMPPPGAYKQQVILQYARAFGPEVFIETGTYKGEMTQAASWTFSRVYSIELSEELFKKAEARFARDGHITIVQGDSQKRLPQLLEDIDQPCVFWLDAHYSGEKTGKAALDTPIGSELQALLDHNQAGHVMLIDDARLFVGENDYPTIAGLEELLGTRPDLDWQLTDKNDIIRIHAPLPGFEGE
jgi:hypothetical protein